MVGDAGSIKGLSTVLGLAFDLKRYLFFCRDIYIFIIPNI